MIKLNRLQHRTQFLESIEKFKSQLRRLARCWVSERRLPCPIFCCLFFHKMTSLCSGFNRLSSKQLSVDLLIDSLVDPFGSRLAIAGNSIRNNASCFAILSSELSCFSFSLHTRFKLVSFAPLHFQFLASRRCASKFYSLSNWNIAAKSRRNIKRVCVDDQRDRVCSFCIAVVSSTSSSGDWIAQKKNLWGIVDKAQHWPKSALRLLSNRLWTCFIIAP